MNTENLFRPSHNYSTDLEKLGAQIQEKLGRVIVVADGAHALGAEKRDLIERITELVKNNILNKEDRDDIFRVCLAACDRELAKLKTES